MHYVGKKISYAILRLVMIVCVVGLLVVDIWSRVKSRGCYMYRGNAAEISVDKHELKLNS